MLRNGKQRKNDVTVTLYYISPMQARQDLSGRSAIGLAIVY